MRKRVNEDIICCFLLPSARCESPLKVILHGTCIATFLLSALSWISTHLISLKQNARHPAPPHVNPAARIAAFPRPTSAAHRLSFYFKPLSPFSPPFLMKNPIGDDFFARYRRAESSTLDVCAHSGRRTQLSLNGPLIRWKEEELTVNLRLRTGRLAQNSSSTKRPKKTLENPVTTKELKSSLKQIKRDPAKRFSNPPKRPQRALFGAERYVLRSHGR